MADSLLFPQSLWGIAIDRKKPDSYEIIGAIIAIIGASLIFYAPR